MKNNQEWLHNTLDTLMNKENKKLFLGQKVKVVSKGVSRKGTIVFIYPTYFVVRHSKYTVCYTYADVLTSLTNNNIGDKAGEKRFYAKVNRAFEQIDKSMLPVEIKTEIGG